MIDFTNAIEEFNNYKGSEKKKTLIYNNKKYLVKFPDPIREKNKNISYINNAFSEYVGSNIFEICGIKTQKTLLGTYKYREKEKVVCACEDFTDEENLLYEFENLALSTNPDKRIETEIKDIMEVIEENKMISTEKTKKEFWKMFIIDSLIGNTDRHNGNWGFILNKKTGKIDFAPIYDCGSCLNPMIEDEEIERISDIELKNLAINCYSCLKENGKKINYMSYIKQMKNIECNNAIKNIFNDIDINKIMIFIDEISCINETRKEFYKNIIKQRYDMIEKIYKKL
ncbi:MAG: HipA domain-containing protein [Clostridia bacterium]